MTGKYLLTLVIILFSFTISPLLADNGGINSPSDSVNVKQILLSQIQRAKQKESVVKPTGESREISENSSTHAAKGNAAFTENLFLKIFILVDSALSIFLFVLWRRRRLKKQLTEKKNLKNNIMKLRQEKLGRKSDSRLDTNRKKLKLEPAFNMASGNEELFISHAKKLSVSVGELQLAAKLSSYERNRG